MIKKAFLGLSLAILGPIPLFAGIIGTNHFSGLDSQDNPASLQPSQSQDLLNVRLQPGGRAVYKRDGYGLFQTLNSISTATVHGGYHFQQSGGADVQLWGSDVGLYASVNDAAFVRVATGTVGATWQCTDNLGFAYCLTNSGIDTPVKTDGSLANTTYQVGIPSGTIIASTPLQLAVAGVSENASSIYFSANNNFLNFGSGPLPTDPYIEIINAPGSRITHMGYYFGNLYWWKDQSFGYISGSASQGTVSITIISNQIGTLDNSSAFWNPTNYSGQNNFGTGVGPTSAGNPYFNELQQLGGIFFRGQDNHIYQYDGYNLTRLSRIITPSITASSRKKENSWTQTTSADFVNGLSSPSIVFSTSNSPGDLVFNGVFANEISSTQWSLGTANNISVYPSSMALTLNNSGTINNPSFESSLSGNWNSSGSSAQFGRNTGPAGNPGSGIGLCTLSGAQNGSYYVSNSIIQHSTFPSYTFSWSFNVVDTNSNIIQTVSIPLDQDCTWRQLSVVPSSSSIGQRVYFQIQATDVVSGTAYLTTSSSYIWGGAISFYFADFGVNNGVDSLFIDNVQNGSSTITSGSFTSQVYDSGFSSSTLILNSSWTVNTTTPSFAIQTSSTSTGPWINLTTSSGIFVLGNEFVRYVATISITSTDNALTSLSYDTIARSTGTYYSAVNNAPSLSSWNNFTSNNSNNGGIIAYYTRASTNSFSITSSTPAWVSQTNNSTVSASTGTFMQARVDFSITNTTQTPTLSDFAFDWFEGSASDKAYIQYFQDAILFSVSSGSSTSKNNTIFHLDLLNNSWLKDNIASNGFLIENNSLYFGDPSAPKVYKYGGVSTDNGGNIQSYWKSMDFAGQDPTVKNDWNQADFSFAAASTTVSFVYEVDQSTITTFTQPLSLYSPYSTIVKRGFTLDRSAVGTYYNFSVGDNSSLAPWTLMGVATTYIPLPWRPQYSL